MDKEFNYQQVKGPPGEGVTTLSLCMYLGTRGFIAINGCKSLN